MLPFLIPILGKVVGKVLDKVLGKEQALDAKKVVGDILETDEEIKKELDTFRSFIVDYEGKASEVSPWIQKLRGSVRPIISFVSLGGFYLLMICGLVFELLPWEAVFGAVVGHANAIFGFWFGSREANKTLERYLKK